MPTDVNLRLRDILKSRRDSLGWNMSELATKLDKSATYVKWIETGKRSIDLDFAPRFAQELFLDPGDVARAVLQEQYPNAYRAIFPGREETTHIREMDLKDGKPFSLDEAVARLPKQIRQAIRNLVEAL